MLAIFRREFRSYFQTPIGYVFLSLFLLLSGIFFTLGTVRGLSPNYAGFLQSVLLILVLVIPLLTMRLLSDDQRLRTDQLLLTSPIRITHVVVGKYLAAVAIYLIAIGVTVLYPVVLSFHGEIDGWETVGSYIGFVLLGASFVSIGLFVSATTENQVVAAIVTFVALLISWFIDFIRQAVPSDPTTSLIYLCVIVAGIAVWLYLSTRNVLVPGVLGVLGIAAALIVFFVKEESYVGFAAETLEWLSLVQRYSAFPRGVLAFEAIVYYVTVSLLFIFLTVRLIEKKRWS